VWHALQGIESVKLPLPGGAAARGGPIGSVTFAAGAALTGGETAGAGAGG
jgi:hypothetical protein